MTGGNRIVWHDVHQYILNFLHEYLLRTKPHSNPRSLVPRSLTFLVYTPPSRPRFRTRSLLEKKLPPPPPRRRGPGRRWHRRRNSLEERRWFADGVCGVTGENGVWGGVHP